ncbi:MAG: helix-turn-helix transcriptional regulator, partial [Longimicrobiales bacterium]
GGVTGYFKVSTPDRIIKAGSLVNIARTDGGEAPSTGALYLALQRLEREGLIRPDPAPPADADGRRRYWALTQAGREAARSEVERMAALLDDAAVQALRSGSGASGG